MPHGFAIQHTILVMATSCKGQSLAGCDGDALQLLCERELCTSEVGQVDDHEHVLDLDTKQRKWGGLGAGLYKILLLLRGFCARINHPFIAPSHLHCPHYCNTMARLLRNIRRPTDPPFVCHIARTIARLLRNIRRPPDPPFVCHTPYTLGNGNIMYSLS